MKTIKKIFLLFVLLTLMVTTPVTIYAKPSKKQVIKKIRKVHHKNSITKNLIICYTTTSIKTKHRNY